MVDVVIKGADGQDVKVNKDGQLVTKAIVESELENASESTGLAFSWSSRFATAGTDLEVLSIRNDSNDKLLHLERVWLGAAAAAEWTLNRMTSGTPAGTTVIGRPLNVDADKTADATAFGDASVTGSLAGDVKGRLLTPAGQTLPFDLSGAWIYGKNDTFFIGCLTNTTISVTLIGHFGD